MKANRHNRGSVLMEFIIVFPIYLVLFGGVFMIGDMAVHTTRLAAAERTAAFDLQSKEITGKQYGWRAIRNKLFHLEKYAGMQKEIADDTTLQDNLYQVDSSGNENRWDSYWYAAALSRDCPWSLQAAMKIRDDYKLPVGGVAGRLSYATWFLGSVGPHPYSEATSDSRYMALIGGKQRVDMYSKDNSRMRNYNYYTLKRTKYRSYEYPWRDNRRPASDLVVKTFGGVPSNYGKAHAWDTQVYHEEWHSSIKGTPKKNRSPTSMRRHGKTVEYQRYRRFVEWSK